MVLQLKEKCKSWKKRILELQRKENYDHGCSARGISRAFLNQLLQYVADEYPNLTTKDFCEQYVKETTRTFNCSLLNLLRVVVPELWSVSESEISDKATVFVSHAWKSKAHDLLSALIQQPTRRYFWIDIITLNQHQLPTGKAWFKVLGKCIEEIGQTVLVFNQYRDPLPLQRSWCLLEICFTIQVGKLDIVMVQKERDKLSTFAYNNGDISAFFNIDLSKAEATKKCDEKRILRHVQTELGNVERVNTQVKNAIREWLRREGIATWYLKTAPNSDVVRLADSLTARFTPCIPPFVATQARQELFQKWSSGENYEDEAKQVELRGQLTATVDDLNKKLPELSPTIETLSNGYGPLHPYTEAVKAYDRHFRAFGREVFKLFRDGISKKSHRREHKHRR